jgi:hypothetical protein
VNYTALNHSAKYTAQNRQHKYTTLTIVILKYERREIHSEGKVNIMVATGVNAANNRRIW